MELTIKNTIELIAILFFVVTYAFSAFEKLADWKGTVAYYNDLFKDTFVDYWIPSTLGFVILLEIIILIGLLYGGYQFIESGSTNTLYFSYIISAFLLLIFLIGQRILKDYDGAKNIAIYLIFNIIGLYFLN